MLRVCVYVCIYIYRERERCHGWNPKRLGPRRALVARYQRCSAQVTPTTLKRMTSKASTSGDRRATPCWQSEQQTNACFSKVTNDVAKYDDI